jgi:hypothetical protein
MAAMRVSGSGEADSMKYCEPGAGCAAAGPGCAAAGAAAPASASAISVAVALSTRQVIASTITDEAISALTIWSAGVSGLITSLRAFASRDDLQIRARMGLP